MLQIQRLQERQVMVINSKLAQGFTNLSLQLAENRAWLDAKFDALTGVIGQLCTELAEERSQQRHYERSRMGAFTRVIASLAQATILHSRRTLALQVEMGHYSGDVPRGLQHMTDAVEALQTSSLVTGIMRDAPDSEVSSRTSVSTAETHMLHRNSNRQPTSPQGKTHQATRRGRK